MKKMNEMPTLASMKQANADTFFNDASYVHWVSTGLELNEEFYTCLLNVISPQLELHDDFIFVSSLEAVRRYDKFVGEGTTKDEAQYWANCFHVSESLGFYSFELDVRYGEIIANGWRNALLRDFPERPEQVQTFEAYDGEIWVVMAKVWPNDYPVKP